MVHRAFDQHSMYLSYWFSGLRSALIHAGTSRWALGQHRPEGRCNRHRHQPTNEPARQLSSSPPRVLPHTSKEGVQEFQACRPQKNMWATVLLIIIIQTGEFIITPANSRIGFGILPGLSLCPMVGTKVWQAAPQVQQPSPVILS